MNSRQRDAIGVDGLDAVLGGGLLPGRAYTLRGGAGTGTSILGVHFLTRVDDATSSLSVSLEEATDRITQNATALDVAAGVPTVGRSAIHRGIRESTVDE